MAWAPPNKGEDLALVRGEIRRAQIETDRARRNADAAPTPEAHQRLTEKAEAAACWEQMTRGVAAQLTEAQAGCDTWENTVRPTLHRAVAADAALRRRHPGQAIEPLRGTPTPAAESTQPGKPARQDSEREHVPVEPRTPEAATAGAGTGGRAEPEAGRMAEVHWQIEEVRARLTEADMHQARQAQEKAAEVTTAAVPATDPDAEPSVGWVDDLQARQRQAVHHDPLPRVPASPAIPGPEAAISAPEAAD